MSRDANRSVMGNATVDSGTQLASGKSCHGIISIPLVYHGFARTRSGRSVFPTDRQKSRRKPKEALALGDADELKSLSAVLNQSVTGDLNEI